VAYGGLIVESVSALARSGIPHRNHLRSFGMFSWLQSGRVPGRTRSHPSLASQEHQSQEVCGDWAINKLGQYIDVKNGIHFE